MLQKDKAQDRARELNLPDSNLIINMVYLNEEDLAVAILNASLRVFKVSTSEILYETTYVDSTVFFQRGLYNIDDDGNLYLLTNDGALVFNADRELIAIAKGVVDFEFGTNYMVFNSIYSSESRFVGGLVPLDEMLNIAEIKMK